MASLGCSLLHILDSFPSLSMRDSDTRTVKIRLGVEMPLKLLANEVRALAYCNRALRRQLLPIVFADFAMGTLDDDKPNDTEFEKLASLASTGDETLACVRSVWPLFLCTGFLWHLATHADSDYIASGP